MKNLKASFASMAVLVTVAAGCGPSPSTSYPVSSVSSDPSFNQVAPTPVPILDIPDEPGVTTDLNICDPFGSGETGSGTHARSGLFAKLYYVPEAKKDLIRTVEDVFANGKKVDANIFFNQVNRPTVNFTDGFSAPGQPALTTETGEKLTEWFGMQMTTQLGLAPGQAPGYYQLVMISDDGGVVRRLRADGSSTILVDNNGTHSTGSVCSSKAVYLDGVQKVALQVDYHQGPRERIAVVLMWRKVSSEDANPNESGCGETDDEGFFGAGAQSPYNKLLSGGFTIVPPAAFNLPANAPAKICK